MEAVEEDKLLHRLVHPVQADVLHDVEDLEVLFDLVSAEHALVEAVEGRTCSFNRSFVSCGQDQLTDALDMVLLSHQLLSYLEVRIILLNLLGAPTIAHSSALHHLVEPLVLCVLDQQLQAEVLLEIFLRPLS